MMKIVILNQEDNVGTVTTKISKGETISYELNGSLREVTAIEEIKLGHKISLQDLNKHNSIIKYGEVIGEANCEIKEGSLVHVHNVQSLRGRGDLKVIEQSKEEVK